MQTIKDLKKYIILIIIIMALLWGVLNIDNILGFFGKIINVLSPFIIGLCLAYVLNIPSIKFEKLLKEKIKNPKFPYRVVSIVLSLIIFILLILFIAFLLIPELIENITLLIQNIPGIINNIETYLTNLLEEYPAIQKEISNVFSTDNLSNIIMNILNSFLSSSVNLISSLVSSIFSIFTSLIFAIYMLSQKEKLITSIQRIMKAYVKEHHYNKIMNIFRQSNRVFNKFICGQCVEALILGLIFFAVLTIFKFPYALIISVLTSITALIPIFGALIALVVGALLILITSPIKAGIFVVIFLVIQQIEGNLIYPKVVGASVGLSPILTLLAITIGGGLFGIVGMFISIPIASIINSLLVSDVNKRLSIKK